MGLQARISSFKSDPDNLRWLMDCEILLGCLAVLSAIFWHETAGAVQVWIVSPTFNHCFLILPIALFMMWERRRNVAEIERRPALAAAGLILLLSFAWLLAHFMSVLELQQFIVLTMLQGVLLCTFGWPLYRRYMAGFLYLYFLVPSGAEFVPQLQEITAKLAVSGLHIIGIPVFSDGAIIDTPSGSFAVAEACAGLRFLIAAIAFGVFYSTLIYRSIFRRLLFIALSIAIPILANGLRVFGLIAAAQWLGDPTAALADHLLYGWIFFSIVLIALIFAGRAFSDIDHVSPPVPQPALAAPANFSRTLVAVVISIVCVAAFPVAAMCMSQPRELPLPAMPQAVSMPWTNKAESSGWKPVVVSPSKTFSDTFSDGEHTVYRFEALFTGSGAANLLRSENRVADEHEWKLDSNRVEQVKIGNQNYPVVATKIANGTRRLTVWSFYEVEGGAETSTLSIKLRQLRERFSPSHCVDAFVALATPDEDATELAHFIAASEPFKRYLCSEHQTAGQK
jgi:exosortase A